MLFISTDIILFGFVHPQYINVSFYKTLSNSNFYVGAQDTLNLYFHSVFSNRELQKSGILYDGIYNNPLFIIVVDHMGRFALKPTFSQTVYYSQLLHMTFTAF